MVHKRAEFKPFPKLPTEVRLMVWKLLIRPRILEIKAKKHSQTIRGGSVPITLHINRESRIEALKSYKLIFSHMRFKGPSWEPANDSMKTLKQIYANFAMDTFYVGNQDTKIGRISSYSGPEGLGGDYSSELQHFGCHYASSVRPWYAHGDPNGPNLNACTEELLSRYTNLSTFTVVLDNMLAKKPGRWEFIEQKISMSKGRAAGRYYRQYCTEEARDNKLEYVQKLLDRMKKKHPEWKKPIIEGKSLIKRPASQWLG